MARHMKRGKKRGMKRGHGGAPMDSPFTPAIHGSKRGKKRVVRTWSGHVTYARGRVIPKRQMVPEQSTGGIGEWGEPINQAAEVQMGKWLGR